MLKRHQYKCYACFGIICSIVLWKRKCDMLSINNICLKYICQNQKKHNELYSYYIQSGVLFINLTNHDDLDLDLDLK